MVKATCALGYSHLFYRNLQILYKVSWVLILYFVKYKIEEQVFSTNKQLLDNINLFWFFMVPGPAVFFKLHPTFLLAVYLWFTKDDRYSKVLLYWKCKKVYNVCRLCFAIDFCAVLNFHIRLIKRNCHPLDTWQKSLTHLQDQTDDCFCSFAEG